MSGIDRKAELEYLTAFAKETGSKLPIDRAQLRALWTAYCLHQNIEVDTADYDMGLFMLWCAITGSSWDDFEDFDGFMCANLV